MNVELEATDALKYVRCTAGTDIGMRREENQDSYGIIDAANFRLFIVADGMGGVQGGATASSMAVSIVEQLLKEKTSLTTSDISEAVNIANKLIFEKGASDSELNGMGTTFVGLAFIQNKLIVINVGDSRAYRFRENQVVRLTEDHTLVMELVRSGTLTLEQAGNHPVSHMLTRSLGPTPEIEVDTYLSKDGPLASDKYLLCSDGLYNLVTENEMLEVLNSHGVDEATEILIDLANQRGGTDNVTLIIVEVDKEFPEDPEIRAQYVAAPDGADQIFSTHKATKVIETQSLPDASFEAGIPQEEDASAQIENGEQQTEEGVYLKDPYAVPELDDALLKHRQPKVHSGDDAEANAETGESTQESNSENSEAKPSEATAGSGSVKSNPVVSSNFNIEDISKTLVGEGQNVEGEDLAQDGASRGPAKSQASFVSKFSTRSLIIMFVVVGLIGALAGLAFDKMYQKPITQVVPSIAVPSGLPGLPPAPKFSDRNNEANSNVASNNNPTLNSLPPIESSPNNVGSPGVEVSNNSNTENITVPLMPSSGSSPITITGPAKRDHLEERLKALKLQLEHLHIQATMFDGPVTGKLGEDLRTQNAKVEEYAIKVANVRNEIDTATRKLTIWYRRRTLLQDTDLTNLASEVAVSSETVRKAKVSFELASWNYLKEAEALRYAPTDKEQKKKVDDLINIRNQKLGELNDQVRKAIDDSIHDSERQITELTLERDKLHEEMDNVNQSVELARVILGSDSAQKSQKKVEIDKAISATETSIKEIEASLQTLAAPSGQATGSVIIPAQP